MKEITCCFTGHRTVPAQELPGVQKALEDVVLKLARKGYQRFLCGGAIGFDTLAALAVLEAKKENPHLRLELILPCADQSQGWNQARRQLWEDIRRQADGVEVLFESYRKGCMHQRNREMVDRSSVCVAYLTRPSGGTYYTVEYAKKQGLKILIYSPTGGKPCKS